MGDSTRIIAFSLFGDRACYYEGAAENLRLAKIWYPEFTCRFYVSAGKRVDLPNVIPMTGSLGYCWRFYAADDAEICLFRDADSRICERGRRAVDAWLASDKNSHIMRDHPLHRDPIMGGMWGVRGPVLRGIREAAERLAGVEYGADQRFLADWAYPKLNPLEHSACGVRFRNPIHPFPTFRTGDEYVGLSIKG